jgi:hypothetical protein
VTFVGVNELKSIRLGRQPVAQTGEKHPLKQLTDIYWVSNQDVFSGAGVPLGGMVY